MIEFAPETNEDTAKINELFSAESMAEHRFAIDGDFNHNDMPTFEDAKELLSTAHKHGFMCGHIVVPVPDSKEQQLSFFGDM